MGMTVKNAKDVQTAPLIALGLIGGWLTARETGLRPLGAVPLALAGVWSARTWLAKRGPWACAGLTVGYLGAFGASHPLAKKIGAWPSVLAVTAAAAGAAALVSDRD